MTDANERMAALLRPDQTPVDPVIHNLTSPDYTTWERFPEMQEYVRGLETAKQWAILMRVNEGEHAADLFHITPTILRDSIIEVCDD